MFLRESNPLNANRADIIVGLASYNEADSIAYPTSQADAGLKLYYPDRSCAIVNCDNHSPDNTEEAFMAVDTQAPKIYITTPPDTPGKGYNFENLFRKALEMEAETLVCLDADLLSVTPEWIKYFVEPIAQGYDFVNPVYSRHKYDGTITKNICYPIVYGLFCRNIRQPIGGDFALSRRFVRHLVCQPWHLTTEEYGIDVFMTMNAITGGFKTCNTGLGAKVHKPSAPKLGPMFMQVVSTAFLTVLRSFEQWKTLDEVEEQELFGLKELDPPQDLSVDRGAIEKQARDGFAASRPILEKTLSGDLYGELSAQFDGGRIDIEQEQWVRIVFEMIVAFGSEADRPDLVESFKSLYFGRTLSFMNKTWDWDADKAEEEVVAQARLFHSRRGMLIEKIES